MHVVSSVKYRCKYYHTNRQDRRYSNVIDLYRNVNSSSFIGYNAVRTGWVAYRRPYCFQVSVSDYNFSDIVPLNWSTRKFFKCLFWKLRIYPRFTNKCTFSYECRRTVIIPQISKYIKKKTTKMA